ncbi:hypothetical protein D3C78_760790 [compost metagenome]
MFLVAGVGVRVEGLVEVLVGVVVLVVADAAAEDHAQRVARLQAYGAIETGLPLVDLVVTALRDVRFGKVAAPVEDAARHRRIDRAVPGRILLGLRGHETDHRLVLAAEQTEGAAGVQVDVVLHAVAFELADVHEHPFAGQRVRVAAAGGGKEGVVLGVQAVVGRLEFPVALQAVFQRGEGGLRLELAAAPIGGRVKRAREVGARTVAEIDREAGPGRAARFDVLVVDTEGEQGVRVQVVLGDAVEHVLLLLVVVEVGVAVLVDADEASAQRAVLVDRAGNIALGTVVVPGAGATADGGLEFAGRALADQVDGGGRIARAGHQAGGALEHFDAVVDGHVGMAYAVVVDAVVHRVDAIVLVVGDGEAARGELPAVAVVVLRADAGGAVEHVGDAGGALVVHLLAGDHGDALRGLADRQRQLGRGGGRAGSVGAGALGGLAKRGAGNGGGAEFQRVVRHRDQDVAAIALAAGLQAAAIEQAGQRLIVRITPADTLAAQVAHRRGVERQRHAGGIGEGIQRPGRPRWSGQAWYRKR